MTATRKMLEFRFGKKPAVHDHRTLSFGAYLTPALPPPPAEVDHYSKVDSWPVYKNDVWGDCTCAAAGHMVQNWTANSTSERTPSVDDVAAMYEHFVGNPPPPDEGCNMLQVLRYWRKHGMATDRISAFTALDLRDHAQLKSAVHLFGSAYLGVTLPDSVCVPGKMLETPWVVPASGPTGQAAPDPNNGHCVPAVGYDADNIWVVTWGALKSMSWDFYDAYTEEAYAVLSTDFLDARGHTVTGFDLPQLRQDLAAIN